MSCSGFMALGVGMLVRGNRPAVAGLRGFLLASTVVAGLAVAGLAAAGIARAQAQGAPAPTEVAQGQTGRVVAFNIPAQDLDSALTRLADQAGIRLLFTSRDLAGKRTAGLAGNYTVDQALTTVLAGSGFTWRLGESNTVVLERLGASSAGGALQLDPVRVEGQQAAETAYGPIQGYVAHQSATATKTDTPLLETPQAISVVGREQMQAQNAQSLVEALRYTPGVISNFGTVDTRFDSIRVRGFLAPLFLDGMLLPSGATQFGRIRPDPFGLERVEVLRGPSSALYGQIPPGGMLNLVSLRPTRDPVHMVELQGNSFGQLQGGVDLGGPLTEDGKFLYRLTGLVHGGGTQIDQVNDNRFMIQPAITWQPSSDTTLTVLGQFQRDVNGVATQFLPAQGTLMPNPFGTLPMSAFVGDPNYNSFQRTQFWAGYMLEHRFNEAITVRQNLRYASVDTNLAAVIGVGLQANLRTLNRVAYSVPEAAQDLTLDNQAQVKFATGPVSHTALFGLDYVSAASQSKQGIGAAPSLDMFNPFYGQPITPPAITVSTGQNQNQLGLYFQDQLAFDRWRLTLSGRNDWVQTVNRDFVAHTQGYQSNSAFSGRAGLNYVFDFGLSPYISYSSSFQPTLGTGFGGTFFQPTTGRQYEIGIKYEPKDINLALNAAAYKLIQQNALTPDPAHPGFNVQTGEITVQGIELGATLSLAKGFNLVGAYTYTNAIVTQSTGVDLNKEVVTVPQHQASLWADKTILEGKFAGLGFGAGVRYFGPTWGNAANTLLLPGYPLVDAAIHYDLGEFNPKMAGARLALNASNLMNTQYVATCTSVSACFYGAERQVTLTLRYNW